MTDETEGERLEREREQQREWEATRLTEGEAKEAERVFERHEEADRDMNDDDPIMGGDD
jgi:hypothetical protein